MAHLLFSYGTLQLPSVQQATFGELLAGEPDAIAGHRLAEVRITDPAVIALSGIDVHPMLVPEESGGAVEGTVYCVTDAQLAAADAYEVDAYRRAAYPLRSGRTAWVYVLATRSRDDEP